MKKCRVQSEMTPKHRERWKLEVDIMQRLSHPNVIAAKDVPPEINVMAGELPLLAMEYCSKGDLRKVTDKTELKDFYYNLIKKFGKNLNNNFW